MSISIASIKTLICEKYDEAELYASVKKKHDHCYLASPYHNIHHEAVKTQNYEKYHKMLVQTGQYDHSIEHFKKLQSCFSLDLMEPIQLIYDDHFFIVLDGCHRLSIITGTHLSNILTPQQYVIKNKQFIPLEPNIQFTKSEQADIQAFIEKTTEQTLFNDWKNNGSYHTHTEFNLDINGQRIPAKRIESMKRVYDFKNKHVLDLGCNTGGMIYQLLEHEDIALGCGVDFDKTDIVVANKIKDSLLKKNVIIGHKVQFDVCDLNTPDHLHYPYTFDCILILSMLSWIHETSKLIDWILGNTKTIFYESNNDFEKEQSLAYFQSKGCHVEFIERSLDDTTGNHQRELYFITHQSIIKPTLYVELIGGLANQLCQIACAMQLQKRIDNSQIQISPYINERLQNITPRGHYFNTVFKEMPFKIRKMNRNSMRLIKEEKPIYQNINVEDIKEDIFLDGYWMSYHYFNEVFDEIKMYLHKNIPEKYKRIAQSLENSVLVHVRGGDYLKFEETHTNLIKEGYYQRVFKSEPFKKMNRTIIYYTDDYEYLNKMIGYGKLPKAKTLPSKLRDYEVFWIVSHCQFHVIANSTFSFWASYLSESKNVIAPKQWFAKSYPLAWNITDIIPTYYTCYA